MKNTLMAIHIVNGLERKKQETNRWNRGNGHRKIDWSADQEYSSLRGSDECGFYFLNEKVLATIFFPHNF